MKLKKEFIWSFLSNIASQFISPFIFVVLARLLAPEDFGIIAMIMVIITFSQIFKDAGLGQAIIVAEKEDSANFIFTFQIIIGIFIYIILFLLASPIAGFYKTPEVKDALRVLAFIFILSPFIDIPVYLSMRSIKFKTVFIRTSMAPLAGGIFSIFLAILNYGFWALILGRLFGEIITALFFILFIKWKPKLDFDFQANKKYFTFGINILLQGLYSWLMGAADKFLLGRYGEKKEVGYYEVAIRASTIPYSLISVPINKLMYPVMAEKNRLKKNLSDLYMNILKKISLISIPTAFFLILVSDKVFSLLLGERWLDSSKLFNWLIIMSLTATIVTLNIEVFKALNRPDIMTKFLAVRGLASIPVYYFSVQEGVLALAVSRAILALVFSPINAYIVTKKLNIRYVEFIKLFKIPLIETSILVSIYYLLLFLEINQNFHFILFTIVFVLLMFIFIYKYERGLLQLLTPKFSEQ